MYQNSIRRITPNSQLQFFIRRSEIAFDERLPFIEHVLAVLIESRFGPCDSRVLINLSNCPEPGAAPLYDLCDVEPNGLVQYYALSPLSSLRRRNGYQVIEAAYRRAKQMGFLDANMNARNSTTALPPNQGRGSP